MPARAQRAGHVVRLPQGQLRTSRADAQCRHYLRSVAAACFSSCSGSVIFSEDFSGLSPGARLKIFCTTSIKVGPAAPRAALFNARTGVCSTLLMIDRKSV